MDSVSVFHTHYPRFLTQIDVEMTFCGFGFNCSLSNLNLVFNYQGRMVASGLQQGLRYDEFGIRDIIVIGRQCLALVLDAGEYGECACSGLS